MSSSCLTVPKYDAIHQSGFIQILSDTKFLGFCADIEDSNRALLLNRPLISRQELETLYTTTITTLHGIWCADINQGGALSKAQKEDYLAQALALMEGEEVNKFWAKKAKEVELEKEQLKLFGDSKFNVAVGDLANMFGGQSLV